MNETAPPTKPVKSNDAFAEKNKPLKIDGRRWLPWVIASVFVVGAVGAIGLAAAVLLMPQAEYMQTKVASADVMIFTFENQPAIAYRQFNELDVNGIITEVKAPGTIVLNQKIECSLEPGQSVGDVRKGQKIVIHGTVNHSKHETITMESCKLVTSEKYFARRQQQ